MMCTMESRWKRMSSLAQAQCLALALWSIVQSSLAFTLDGRPGAYAKFPSWEPCLNGSFSFEFKTDSSNALLVYLDHGKFKFFELKMIGGSLRLRVNLAEGTVIMRAGEKLDNSLWHQVEVRQDNERTILSVDGVPHSRTAPGSVSDFSDPAVDREVLMFFGGLPQDYDSQLLLLALPSVVFEPRFRGSIRNLFFKDCGGEPHRPEMIDSFGLRSVDVDFCERGNPCLNKGVCLTTDDGLLCDCGKTEYEGDRCDIEKVPSDATFFGAQYLSYNLSSGGEVLDSNRDQVSLDFRTKQPDGLLFYTGNRKDYLNLAIKDGVIVLTINLGTGSYEEVVPRERMPRLDDNLWHHVLIRREAREISVMVDGIHRESGSTTGRYTRLSSKLLYVAGSPNTSALPGSRVRSNFRGCMRKVRYRADSVEMDLTELARSQHPLLKITGEVIYDKCQELSESSPITFTTPQSYLTIPTWDRAQDRGSLAFQFQTVEQNGLLIYSTGAAVGNRDFIALELVDGYMNLVLNQGSGTVRIMTRGKPVSDGKPHNVYLEFRNNRGYITVDGHKEVFASSSHLDRFDLAGSLSIGGVSKNREEVTLPRELWAGLLGKGYVGCLLDMVMNGNKVDLVTTAQLQGIAGVAEYCQVMEPQCFSQPCMHHGVCVEGWNRFTCDCRATGFIDSFCQTAAATLQFDGSQFVKVTQPEESETQAEEISLRFRTMYRNGLLFMTTSDVTADTIELYLENGVINLRIDVGNGPKLLSVGHMLNDDRWHTAYIKRRGHRVELKIDILRPVAEQLSGSDTALSIKSFFIGYPSLSKSVPEINRRAAQFDFHHVDIDDILQDDNQVHSYDGFIGSMQQFIFNDNLFFEMARTGQVENIQLTARLSSEGYVVANPVTFKSMDAYAVLPQLRAHDTFTISFQLKTTESDGLLLYNVGKGQDFLALELTDGFLYYVYNMGAGTQRIRANVNEKLNDNRWHEIRVLRTETYKQRIRVDDNTPTVDDLSGAGSIYFDLDDNLYLGGVEKMMYHTLPKKIEARHGYMGCIGSLDLNNYVPNVLQDADPIHEAVGDGCQGPSSQCHNDSCANRGRCVQQWTSISCDCDMTSYTGPRCLQDSTTYRFGPGTGMITFSYPENSRPSTTRESLALGFRTTSENAVLLRIDSSSYHDYIEVELVRGKVYVVYNMGTRDYPIGETFERLDDGKYHIVRFTRSGPNSTIQVDDLMMQTKTPRGEQTYTFNNQAFVYVGGKKEKNGTVVKPFRGTMTGLVLNGIRILDLAKDRDERIHLEGNVALVQNQMVPKHKDKMKKNQGKNDVSGMQSTMGVGHNVSATTGQKGKELHPSIARYHFTLKLHAMNSSIMLSNTPSTKKKGSKSSPIRSHPQRKPAARRRRHWRRHQRDNLNMPNFEQLLQSVKTVEEMFSNRPIHDNKIQQDLGGKIPKRTINLHGTDSFDSKIEKEIVQVSEFDELPHGKEATRIPQIDPTLEGTKDLFSEWDDEGDLIVDQGEIFAEMSEREMHPELSENEPFPENREVEKEDGESSIEPAKKYLECTFSGSSGTLVTLKHKVDTNSDDEDENDMEGSGTIKESENKDIFSQPQFELIGNSTSSARLASLSEGEGREDGAGGEREKITTVVLPFLVTEGATMSSLLHVTVSGDGKLIDRDHSTTPLNGVTDDIIFSGASPACPYEDEEDCTEVSSGTDDDIFKPTVIVKTTPAPPTTTTSDKSKTINKSVDCKGSHCPEHGEISQQTDLFLSTPDPPPKEHITVKPTVDTGKTLDPKGSSDINIGLIVGIAVSVLVAVVILCVALYKFRRRDEGTYKVDESQNFTSLDVKKSQQGNGTLLSHSGECSGKRGGKKKDVKEWYV